MTANENEEPRAHLERAGGRSEGALGQSGATRAYTAENPGDHHPPHHPPISSSSSSMGACDLDIMEGGVIGGDEKSDGSWGSAVVSPAAPDQSSRTHSGPVVDDPSIPSNTNNESISTSDLRISFMETGGEGGGGGGSRHAGDDTPDTNDRAGSAQAIPSPTLVPTGNRGAKVAAEDDRWKLLLIFVGLLILFLVVAEGISQSIYSAFPDSFSLSKLRKGCYGAASAMVAVVISFLLARKYITSAAADRLRDCFEWITGVAMLIAGCVCAEGVTDIDV